MVELRIKFGDLGVPCRLPEGPAHVCSRWAVAVTHSLVCCLHVWGRGTGWGDRPVGNASHLAVQLWKGKAGERGCQSLTDGLLDFGHQL